MDKAIYMRKGAKAPFLFDYFLIGRLLQFTFVYDGKSRSRVHRNSSRIRRKAKWAFRDVRYGCCSGSLFYDRGNYSRHFLMGYWQMVGIVGGITGILMASMVLAVRWLVKNDGKLSG